MRSSSQQWIRRAIRLPRQLGRRHVAVERFGILVLLGSVGFALLACDRPQPETAARANVLLITVDTLRADHLGAYGYSRPTSPNIDRLAEEGALFLTSYAPMGATCPAHATLFTSRSPEAHRLVRNGLRLAEAERTMAEIMRDNGYATAAFVSSFPVSRSLGFAQGFDTFDDDFESHRFSVPFKHWEGRIVEGVFDRKATATVDAALAWLESYAEGAPAFDAPVFNAPVFIWVHLFDPHYPYRPPPEDGLRFARRGSDKKRGETNMYDGEIRYSDREVGRLREAFEQFSAPRSPLLVLTSDHGEGLWDHGWRSHNRFVYEEEVRVPLLFHWPGKIPPKTRIDQPAQLADILPSLVSALGLEAAAPESSENDRPAARFDGIDLFPFMRGASSSSLDRPIWLQRPHFLADHTPKGIEQFGYGLRLGAWKFIESGKDDRRELYDLASDPEEKTNLASAQAERAEALSKRLATWRKEEAAKRLEGELIEPTEAELRALRALGYTEQ